ncbi:ankyrin repeat-containing protein BDA1-like [Papaver somniferum]|uniref:ankyrin repeat-containing protein BDA1-like n=1 Tax=Papaver somniferum TaxID=3469 RepID=UPI000E6FAF14|nr:ankyrin repeat-containing protein BDA1-like [Papaver somniferum]
MCGHVKFAGELLSKNIELAMEKDSYGFTPLHLASARQCPSMVKKLLGSNQDACLERDNEGRTPLHFAAMKDRVKIIKELIKQKPEAIHIRNHKEETIFHFCVKHDSLNALKLLVEEMPSIDEPTDTDMIALSINSKNSDGNTILHLAAKMKQMKSKNIDIKTDIRNNKGVKALHMFSKAERDDLEIGCYNKKKKTNPSDSDQKWMLEKVNALMVVATLVAGIAFTAAMNPPGGVFQEDSKIKASENPVIFTYYLRSVASPPNLVALADI